MDLVVAGVLRSNGQASKATACQGVRALAVKRRGVERVEARATALFYPHLGKGSGGERGGSPNFPATQHGGRGQVARPVPARAWPTMRKQRWPVVRSTLHSNAVRARSRTAPPRGRHDAHPSLRETRRRARSARWAVARALLMHAARFIRHEVRALEAHERSIVSPDLEARLSQRRPHQR
jgi:hypothetical protein